MTEHYKGTEYRHDFFVGDVVHHHVKSSGGKLVVVSDLGAIEKFGVDSVTGEPACFLRVAPDEIHSVKVKDLEPVPDGWDERVKAFKLEMWGGRSPERLYDLLDGLKERDGKPNLRVMK